MRTCVSTLVLVFLMGSVLEVSAADDHRSQTIDQLLDEFEKTEVDWRQLEVAKRVVSRRDSRVLQRLEPWLENEDRHLRGNAAFIFAGLGDPRGLKTIGSILSDRSERPEGQGISGGKFSVEAQIRADRYYAVHLLGGLKDLAAVDLLIPFLDDAEINYNVAWALGEIGDTRATSPLIDALDDRDALVRVCAINALLKLRATEALPKLRQLLSDDAMPSAGDRVSVAETAEAAIAKLQKEP